MKNNIFRSIEFWKMSLMALPDNVFFELIRTVFGKIKTPFNKQFLLNDLENFFSQTYIKNNITCYLNRNDSRIIAAIAVLDDPVRSELENFFAGEINSAELHSLVVNLEERFIVYRFQDNGQSRLSLNPVLEPVLLPVASDKTSLFESVLPVEIPRNELSHNQEDKKNNFIFDDRILAALLSYVSQNEMFYRKGGGIRQKLINEINVIFPNLPQTGLSAESIIGGLRVLGLFIKDGERLLPDYRRFHDFGNLSRRERVEYYAAGIYYFCHIWIGHSFSSRLLRQKFSDLAVLIHLFLDSLDPERLYTTVTLHRILYAINRTNRDSSFTAFTDVLEKTNLIAPVSVSVAEPLQGEGSPPNQYWRIQLPVSESSTIASSSEKAVITTDSPYSFLVYPEIAYNDVMALSAFSRVNEAGATFRFELNRDCTIRAFNRNISADTMIKLLQRLSRNRIDENLIFTLHDWEKRHGEVKLFSGTVLTLSPERRYLADTYPLTKFIAETLSPGIYLLSPEAEEKAAEALRKAGATIFTGRGNNQTESCFTDTCESSDIPSDRFYQNLHSGPYITEDADSQNMREHAPPSEGDRKESSASTLIGGFHSILEKMNLIGEERDELTARIERRLILCESQLKDAVVRYEKLEARGLDYNGKALIAKQAISLQTPVEIYLSGQKKNECVFGIPRALEKTESENILILEQSGEIIRIPLGKISLLRRVKKSIFENDTIKGVI